MVRDEGKKNKEKNDKQGTLGISLGLAIYSADNGGTHDFKYYSNLPDNLSELF